jgi:phage tail sheath protein FI
VAEYLAPGVYVEETSFRSKSIEGVGTSTTGFVGLARKGPLKAATFVTSSPDFQRIFGGFYDLKLTADGKELEAAKQVNYLAHAVQAFFDNGGSRLYVSRVFGGDPALTAKSGGLPASVPDDKGPIRFRARFPGTAGNGHISTRLNSTGTSGKVLNALPAGSFVRVQPTGGGDKFLIKNADSTFQLGTETVKPAEIAAKVEGATLSVLTFDVSAASTPSDPPMVYEGLGFSPSHPRWAGAVLSLNPKRLADAQENLFALEVGADVTPDQLLAALFPDFRKGPTENAGKEPAVKDPTVSGKDPTRNEFDLTGGTDGSEPTFTNYRDGLAALESVEEIAIVAAPGSSAFAGADAIMQELLIHVQKPRAYRIAILESPPGVIDKEIKDSRSKVDSTYAAYYYPWVWVANPLARPEVHNIPPEVLVPPAGFIAGIYARTDNLHGVAKAPANEPVLGALRFERDINFAEQGILNPLGINCLRFFSGRGYRVWGARTASSDPEWKYVNVRRYFLYLEHSIDNSTQWAVFENNGPALWDNIRQTVESFLYSEWKNGALLGTKPEEAYFVRCDRSTMTQNDLDNGRMVCLIGVAVLKPAEFVIFRIGQKTADAKG